MTTVTAVVLTVPASEADLAADALWALGVAAIEERPGDGAGTEDRLVELWTSLGSDDDVIRRALDGLPSRWRWHVVQLDGEVVHTWRAYARPTWVHDDLVIVPAWYEGSLGAAASTATIIRVDPEDVFGMGDHPTTMASLRSLRRALHPQATVLDVGCGSGVLAIAALMEGAVHAEAIDISAAAVTVTGHNARRNGVEGRLAVSTTPLSQVQGRFDLVVANILAPMLRELSGDLRRVLEPDGVLIVSGLLAERYDHVVEALAPLRLIDVETCEGWVALTLRW